ncbi:MAG: hypothetical protein K2Y71_06650 [Xanthobacteraceae bacterium]|nr:hypothetical protein [Xanthobacteraceae bacterium]
MTPSEHFMQHAAECKFMASLARDPESKKTWMGMAERWHRCAELAKEQSAYQAKQARHRKQVKSWSH